MDAGFDSKEVTASIIAPSTAKPADIYNARFQLWVVVTKKPVTMGAAMPAKLPHVFINPEIPPGAFGA